MIPFEFTVPGPPVSLQAKNRTRLQAWKNKVHQHAKNEWPASNPPIESELRSYIVYYHEGLQIDTDNMVKPVLDALSGLVYLDDSQIVDTLAHRRNLDASFRVKGMSEVLARAFVLGKEFIHVRIQDPLDQTELV